MQKHFSHFTFTNHGMRQRERELLWHKKDSQKINVDYKCYLLQFNSA